MALINEHTTCQFLKIPTGVTEEMEKQMRWFLLEEFDGKRKWPVVAWETCCRSKEKVEPCFGGLIQKKNGLMSKMVLLPPFGNSGLMAKVIHAIYNIKAADRIRGFTVNLTYQSPWMSVTYVQDKL